MLRKKLVLPTSSSINNFPNFCITHSSVSPQPFSPISLTPQSVVLSVVELKDDTELLRNSTYSNFTHRVGEVPDCSEVKVLPFLQMDFHVIDHTALLGEVADPERDILNEGKGVLSEES